MPMQECRFWSNPYNYLILLQVTFCIILPVWSICLIFCCFAPIHSLSNSSGLERLLDCRGFYSNPLFVQFFQLGAFLCFPGVLLQLTLHVILPAWSIPLFFCCFTPIRLLPVPAPLEDFPIFHVFAPIKEKRRHLSLQKTMVYINNHFLTDAYSTLSSSQCL